MVSGTLAGGAIGAGAGYFGTQDDGTGNRGRNALAGGAVGAGMGALAGGLMGHVPHEAINAHIQSQVQAGHDASFAAGSSAMKDKLYSLIKTSPDVVSAALADMEPAHRKAAIRPFLKGEASSLLDLLS